MEFDPRKAFKRWLAMGGKLREEELRPKWHLLKCLMPNGDFYAAMIYCDEQHKTMFMTMEENEFAGMMQNFLTKYDAGELE